MLMFKASQLATGIHIVLIHYVIMTLNISARYADELAHEVVGNAGDDGEDADVVGDAVGGDLGANEFIQTIEHS